MTDMDMYGRTQKGLDRGMKVNEEGNSTSSLAANASKSTQWIKAI